jgi:hypothetical protein
VLVAWSRLRLAFVENARRVFFFLFDEIYFRNDAGLLDFRLAFIKINLL